MSNFTALTMEALEVWGPNHFNTYNAPEDALEIPNDEELNEAFSAMLDILEDRAIGTVLEDYVGDIIEGMCNSIHFKISGLDKRWHNLSTNLSIKHNEFDGSEIGNDEIDHLTDQLKQLESKTGTFEAIKSNLIQQLRDRYEIHWLPPRGSSVSISNKLTSSYIDSKRYLSAARAEKRTAAYPQGTFIGFSGGKDFEDANMIHAILDKMKSRYPDMILAHGGTQSGAELIADKWATINDVHRIPFIPDFAQHKGRAPFERNRQMIEALPFTRMIVTPGTGIQFNMIDEAERKNIKLIKIGYPKRKQQSASSKA